MGLKGKKENDRELFPEGFERKIKYNNEGLKNHVFVKVVFFFNIIQSFSGHPVESTLLSIRCVFLLIQHIVLLLIQLLRAMNI